MAFKPMLKYNEIGKGCVIKFTEEIPEELSYGMDAEREEFEVNREIQVAKGPADGSTWIEVVCHSDDCFPYETYVSESEWDDCGGYCFSGVSRDAETAMNAFDALVEETNIKIREIVQMGKDTGVDLSMTLLSKPVHLAQWDSSRC